MYRDTLQVCGLCEKVIAADEARVNFGRKTYHGACFIEHCKQTHNKPPVAREGK